MMGILIAAASSGEMHACVGIRGVASTSTSESRHRRQCMVTAAGQRVLSPRRQLFQQEAEGPVRGIDDEASGHGLAPLLFQARPRPRPFRQPGHGRPPPCSGQGQGAQGFRVRCEPTGTRARALKYPEPRESDP